MQFVPALSCPTCPTQRLCGIAERDVYSCQLTDVLKGKLPVVIPTHYLSLFVLVDPDLWPNFWGSATLCWFLDFDPFGGLVLHLGCSL